MVYFIKRSPGHPGARGGGRDDGGVGERPGAGHAARLVAVDPGVVLVDLSLRSGNRFVSLT